MPRPPLTVSVVVPCYNAEAFVAEAATSALGQTVAPVEVLCVDDGSTDGTLGVLRRLEADHPAVRVMTGPNGGPSAARNRGLAEATGDYVQFLDADDLLAPTKLEHQLALAEAVSEPPDLIAASHRHRWDDGEEEVRDVGHDPWVSLVESRLGITSSNLWRREAVLDVGGWREGMHLSEDPELMFRLLRSGASVLRDEACLTTLRRRPDSLWYQDFAESRRSWLAVRLQIVRHLATTGLLTDDRHTAIVRAIVRTIEEAHNRDPGLAAEMYRLAEADLGAELGRAGWGRAFFYRTVGFGPTRVAVRLKRAVGRRLRRWT